MEYLMYLLVLLFAFPWVGELLMGFAGGGVG